MGAVAAVFALRMLTRGHLAQTRLSGQLHAVFQSVRREADLIYFKIVTVNMQFILALVIIILFFVVPHAFGYI